MSNQPLYQLRHNPCRTSFLFYLISISCTSTIKWLILVVVEWFKLWERTQVVCLGFEPVATGMESANESTGLAQLQENLKLTDMRFLSWPFPPCYLYSRESLINRTCRKMFQFCLSSKWKFYIIDRWVWVIARLQTFPSYLKIIQLRRRKRLSTRCQLHALYKHLFFTKRRLFAYLIASVRWAIFNASLVYRLLKYGGILTS